MELQLIPYFTRNIFEVLLVTLRDQDLLDTCAMGGKHFLLDTPNRQHTSTKRNLTRHGQVVAHRYTDEQARQRSR